MPVESYGPAVRCVFVVASANKEQRIETKKGVSGREKQSGPKKLEVKHTQERKHERHAKNT